jgi:YjbE family integral membrane protein
VLSLSEFLSGNFFVGLFLVLLTNVILSGDNAVVIAMAARRLEGSQRRQAIVWGAAGAVVLRLIFAAVVSYLVAVPLLQAVGGLLLFWIAWRLIHDDHDEEGKVQAGTSTWDAIKIIIVADAVMSLDNVIALVGAARGNLLLLAIGVTMTIPLVIFGSTLLAFLIDRFPVFIYAGAGLLAYIAVEMFFQDVALEAYLELFASAEWIVATVAAVVFLAIAWAWARRTGEDEEDPSKLGKS